MKMEWISVKDRLPDQDGEYLIYENGIYIAKYQKKSKEWKEKSTFDQGESQIMDWDVKHWMQLPEQPKDV